MKQRTLISIAFILVILVACHGQKPGLDKQRVSAATEKQVDALFSEYNNLDSAGVAIAVVDKGEVVMLKGYGSANLEHSIPINPSTTRFNIGSTSKQVTVFAALLLAEQKKLSMDDDVRKHIPELQDFGKKVTLKNLAYHTSGMRSELLLLAMAGYTPGDVISRQHVLQMIYRQKQLDFIPGEESSYSNSGYTLLSEVVARVSGQDFEDFAKVNIFEPLGMNDSFFVANHQDVIKNMAYPYAFYQNGFHKSIANEGYSGSTGVFTTAADFTKWVLNFRETRVGSKEIIEQMNTLGVLNNGDTSGFGMGQFIEEYKGLKHIQHGGGTAGYVAYLGRFPDQDFSIILMGNSSSINARGKSLEIADVFLEDYFKEGSFKTNNKDTNFNLANFKHVGNYWNNKDQRSVQVSVNNDALLFAIGGGPTITLAPSGKTEFQMQNVGIDRRVQFRTNNKAENTMHVFVNEKEVESFESYRPKEYSAKELEQFAGRYYSEELDTSYVLAINNESLVVRHLRFADNILVPVISDIFRNTSWRFSTLKFERNTNGKITGFRVSAMRARHIQFKKMI